MEAVLMDERSSLNNTIINNYIFLPKVINYVIDTLGNNFLYIFPLYYFVFALRADRVILHFLLKYYFVRKLGPKGILQINICLITFISLYFSNADVWNSVRFVQSRGCSFHRLYLIPGANAMNSPVRFEKNPLILENALAYYNAGIVC
jgi:hypothetical protein